MRTKLNRAGGNISSIFGRAIPRVRRGVPLLAELAGVALISVAIWRVEPTAAIAWVGVFLLFAGNAGGGDE